MSVDRRTLEIINEDVTESALVSKYDGSYNTWSANEDISVGKRVAAVLKKDGEFIEKIPLYDQGWRGSSLYEPGLRCGPGVENKLYVDSLSRLGELLSAHPELKGGVVEALEKMIFAAEIMKNENSVRAITAFKEAIS